MIETLFLVGRMDKVMDSAKVPYDKPLDIDAILHRANDIFINHNVSFSFLERSGNERI